MNYITSRNEAHGKNRNSPQQDIAIVFLLASTELIDQMARSDIEQDHHHANKKLIVIDCVQNRNCFHHYLVSRFYKPADEDDVEVAG